MHSPHVARFLTLVFGLSRLSKATFHAHCGAPGPAFPVPHLEVDRAEFRNAWETVNHELDDIFRSESPHLRSVSVHVTTLDHSIFSYHQTAAGYEKPQYKNVQPHSEDDNLHPIGELTQLFTVLATLHADLEGHIPSLDVSITRFIPQLEHTSMSSVDWDRITLRSLASQMSGLPREGQYLAT